MGRERNVMGDTDAPLTAFLAVFNTGIDIVLIVAVIHAILDSHVRCGCIKRRRESACRDSVPNQNKSEVKLSHKSREKTNV